MTFIEEYENFIRKVFETSALKEGEEGSGGPLISLLREKRDFGLKKYGDKSFQISLENCMKVDTLEHAREELIDYMNYTLNEMFKNSRIGNLEALDRARERFNRAYLLYVDTK